MLQNIAKKFFGSANDRYIKDLQGNVDAINSIESELETLSDDNLRARTGWLRERIAGGERLDDVLVDAFATVREGAKRVGCAVNALLSVADDDAEEAAWLVFK